MKRSALLVISLASSLALVLGCGSSSKSGGAATASGHSGKPRVTPKNKNMTDNGDGSFTLGGKKCKVTDVIEDAENNDNQVIVKDGRNGYIYSFGDTNGTTMTPEANTTFPQTPGGAQGSAYAACIKGNVALAAIAYAGIGFNLTDPKKAVDLSKHDGLAFRVRRGADSTMRLRLKVPDVATDPDGGVCTDKCFNDFGVDLFMSEEWQMFYLPFSEMKQMSGWGEPRPPAIDPSKVFSLQFQVLEKGKPFEFCIDDISLIKCE
jgi:endoglucanase